MKKSRLDQELVKQGLAASTDEAKRWIMAGRVLVRDQRIEKPGTLIQPDAVIRIKKKSATYASRSGMKLEHALKHFSIEVAGQIALDLGASTGRFTDCLLRFGARKVYAVDVGTNQSAYRLRVDPRVVCLERTHAKHLSRGLVPEPITLLVVDVSFTSLTYVLPFTFPLLGENATAVCLFKPQFEVAREKVGMGGIVDEAVGEAASERMKNWFEAQAIPVLGCVKSPVKGRDGNQEYLFRLQLPASRDKPRSKQGVSD